MCLWVGERCRRKSEANRARNANAYNGRSSAGRNNNAASERKLNSDKYRCQVFLNWICALNCSPLSPIYPIAFMSSDNNEKTNETKRKRASLNEWERVRMRLTMKNDGKNNDNKVHSSTAGEQRNGSGEDVDSWEKQSVQSEKTVCHFYIILERIDVWKCWCEGTSISFVLTLSLSRIPFMAVTREHREYKQYETNYCHFIYTLPLSVHTQSTVQFLIEPVPFSAPKYTFRF